MYACTFMLHKERNQQRMEILCSDKKISPVVVGLKLVILTRSFSGGFYLKLNNACSPK